jgi:Na+(H+)/acetate symporter ActP
MKKQPENRDNVNIDKKADRKRIHLKDVVQDEDSGESFSEKLRFFIIKSLFCILFGLIVMGLGLLLGYLIATHYGYRLQDALFIIGILLVVIGIFASMKGNPVSMNIGGIGMKNANAISYMELETVRLERERTNYYQNFFKNAVVTFAFSGWTILLGGVFIIVVSILFVK